MKLSIILSIINSVFLILIFKKQKKMGAKQDVILDLIAGINDSTNNIAADLDAIAGGITGGLTADEADSVIAQLNDAATKLRAVADINPDTVPPVDPNP